LGHQREIAIGSLILFLLLINNITRRIIKLLLTIGMYILRFVWFHWNEGTHTNIGIV